MLQKTGFILHNIPAMFCKLDMSPCCVEPTVYRLYMTVDSLLEIVHFTLEDTPMTLHEAAKRGDLTAVKTFLEKKKPLDSQAGFAWEL